jgi:hypothetical protein
MKPVSLKTSLVVLFVLLCTMYFTGCGCDTETVVVTKVEESEQFLGNKIYFNTGGFEYGLKREVGERVRVCK